jgi:hypothetical protein
VVINGDMIDAVLHDRGDRGVYLDNLGVSQLVREIAAASKVEASPGGRSLDRSHRHCRH